MGSVGSSEVVEVNVKVLGVVLNFLGFFDFMGFWTPVTGFTGVTSGSEGLATGAKNDASGGSA